MKGKNKKTKKIKIKTQKEEVFKKLEINKWKTPSVGIEPTTTWLKATRSTGWAKTAVEIGWTHKLNNN